MDRKAIPDALHLVMAEQFRMRRKVGAFVLYRLDDPVIEKICTLVCDSLRSELEAQLAQLKRS